MGTLRDIKGQKAEHKHVYVEPEEPVLNEGQQEALYEFYVKSIEVQILRWLKPGPGSLFALHCHSPITKIKGGIILMPVLGTILEHIFPVALDNLQKRGAIKPSKTKAHGYSLAGTYTLPVAPDIPEPEKSILLVLRDKRRTLQGLQRELKRRYQLKISLKDLFQRMLDLMGEEKAFQQDEEGKVYYWFIH